MQGYIPCQDATVRIRTKATNRSSPSSLVQSMEGSLAMNLRKKSPTKRQKIYSNYAKKGMIEKERFFIKSGEYNF